MTNKELRAQLLIGAAQLLNEQSTNNSIDKLNKFMLDLKESIDDKYDYKIHQSVFINRLNLLQIKNNDTGVRVVVYKSNTPCRTHDSNNFYEDDFFSKYHVCKIVRIPGLDPKDYNKAMKSDAILKKYRFNKWENDENLRIAKYDKYWDLYEKLYEKKESMKIIK